MRMMVEVVRHAHALGICHRDIKPENFMLSDRSEKARIKACDFGGWGQVVCSARLAWVADWQAREAWLDLVLRSGWLGCG